MKNTVNFALCDTLGTVEKISHKAKFAWGEVAIGCENFVSDALRHILGYVQAYGWLTSGRWSFSNSRSMNVTTKHAPLCCSVLTDGLRTALDNVLCTVYSRLCSIVTVFHGSDWSCVWLGEFCEWKSMLCSDTHLQIPSEISHKAKFCHLGTEN